MPAVVARTPQPEHGIAELPIRHRIALGDKRSDGRRSSAIPHIATGIE
jgi:hypothetical protein